MDIIGLEIFTWPNWYAWVTFGFLFLILEVLIKSNFLRWSALSAIITGFLVGLGAISEIEYQLTSVFILYFVLYLLYKLIWYKK